MMQVQQSMQPSRCKPAFQKLAAADCGPHIDARKSSRRPVGTYMQIPAVPEVLFCVKEHTCTGDSVCSSQTTG
jgi:hypothetical protein